MKSIRFLILSCFAGMVAGAASAQPASGGERAEAGASAPAAATATEPHIVFAPECLPAYPSGAEHDQAQGTSGLLFTVSPDGQVIAAEIVRHSGSGKSHRLLDAAALSALAMCRFIPARDAQGQPVEGLATVTYTWRLESPGRRIIW